MTLRIQNLCKAFGPRQVLSHITCSFEPGLYALHGPNGIGKSTLLAILAGVQAPDAGSILVDGYDLHRQSMQAKARLAYVPDDNPVYPYLGGRDLLDLVGQAKASPVDSSIDAWIDALNLRPHLMTDFGQMSLGTQKKTLLAAAWIGSPGLLLLDEPSNALDAATRLVLLDALRALADKAVVLMSTHDAEFALAVGAEIIPFDSLMARTGLPVVSP